MAGASERTCGQAACGGASAAVPAGTPTRDAPISRGTPRLAAGGWALAGFGGAPLERPTSDTVPTCGPPSAPQLPCVSLGGRRAELVALSLNLCPWGALRQLLVSGGGGPSCLPSGIVRGRPQAGGGRLRPLCCPVPPQVPGISPAAAGDSAGTGHGQLPRRPTRTRSSQQKPPDSGRIKITSFLFQHLRVFPPSGGKTKQTRKKEMRAAVFAAARNGVSLRPLPGGGPHTLCPVEGGVSSCVSRV